MKASCSIQAGPSSEGPAERTSVEYASSVFDLPRSQWQSAVGERLLTPQEHAARVRYFTRETELAIAKARRQRCA
jgi:hypothetical protein